jgi:hypothetical protein
MMDMDDDDFMGEIEFDLSPEQQQVVSRAIGMAAKGGDAFMTTNPLIAIMQWWDGHRDDESRPGSSAEETLAEICRRFILAHEPGC